MYIFCVEHRCLHAKNARWRRHVSVCQLLRSCSQSAHGSVHARDIRCGLHVWANEWMLSWVTYSAVYIIDACIVDVCIGSGSSRRYQNTVRDRTAVASMLPNEA